MLQRMKLGWALLVDGLVILLTLGYRGGNYSAMIQVSLARAIVDAQRRSWRKRR